MKKIIKLIILALFLVIALPLVNPEETKNMKNTSLDQTNSLKEDLAKERQFAEIKRQKLEKTQDLEEKTIEEFRILEKNELQNIMKLNEEKLVKLAGLNKSQIKKLAEIKAVNLRKIIGLDEKKINKITSLDQAQLEKLSNLDRARLNKFSQLSINSLNKELQKLEIKKINPSALFRKRILTEQKIRTAAERFQVAEQNLLSLKKDLDAEIKLLKKAKGSKDELGVKEHSKKYLLTAADAIINHLEKIKSRVQQSQNIDEEEALELIKDINKKIQELEDLKSSAEDIETKDGIKSIAKDINAAWKRTRISSEFYVRLLVNKKIQETIKRSEQLEKKLDSILAEIEEKAFEVKNIEEILTIFSEKIDEAREKLKESQGKSIKSRATGIEADIQQLIIESKSSSQESEILLKEAHNILTEIVKGIKALYPAVDFEKDRLEEQIMIEEKEETSKVNVEIRGFLKTSQQTLVNSLIQNLNQTKTNAEIEIDATVEKENLELKKEIKGTLTDHQKILVTQLTVSLEDIGENVKIKILAGEFE
ncbi:phage tail tape measure protein [Candidatus Woesearchaeota archaeon]|nr:phage tail tape measure protein [Candidatus Woesearchaeota archaeon]